MQKRTAACLLVNIFPTKIPAQWKQKHQRSIRSSSGCHEGGQQISAGARTSVALTVTSVVICAHVQYIHYLQYTEYIHVLKQNLEPGSYNDVGIMFRNGPAAAMMLDLCFWNGPAAVMLSLK